jgi:glycosyl transferase family 87
MKIWLVLLVGLLFLLVIVLAPVPIPPYLDFQVLYHANLGLLRGITLYDHAGQVEMIAQLAQVAPEQVYVLPFPYPPWYALSTVWLASLPIETAARLWFGLNVMMLLVSVWLLTEGWQPIKRLASFVIAALFPAALGGLFVGQYDFPVLLGAAWMAYALPREKAIQTAIAAALLTLKPHLGLPILLIVTIYLWLRRDPFGRRALKAILLAAIILFAIGFLASPLWPLDYFHSLTGYKADISECQQCNNAAMDLANWLGGGFNQLLWFAAVLLILLTGWLIWQWGRLALHPVWLLSAAVLLTLFGSPYLLNYDYVLLLVPLFLLAGAARQVDWIALALAYLLPLVSLLAGLGTKGNFALVLSVLLLIVAHTARLKQIATAQPGLLEAVADKAR